MLSKNYSFKISMLSVYICIALATIFLLGEVPSSAQVGWSALGSGMGSSSPYIQAVAIDGLGNLYVGGNFTTAGGVSANYIAKWNGSAWIALGSGVSNGAYLPSVKALAVDKFGNLYVGGEFTTAGGVTVNNIAMWNGSSWSALGSGVGGYDYPDVKALAFDSAGNLFVGGRFTTAGGLTANRIAKWNPITSTWIALGSGMGGISYPYVNALAVDSSDNLYAGGAFTTAGGISANYIAKWNPITSTWSALGSGMSGDVLALAVDSGCLYAGGAFGAANGTLVNNIAIWNGFSWSSLSSGMDGYIRTIAVDSSGNPYVGGNFTTAGGISAKNIAKWNLNTSTWSDLGSGMDWQVNSLAVDSSSNNLYAGGSFSTADGISAIGIAKYTLPTRIISVSTDTLYFGGVAFGKTKQMSFTINNTGNSPLTVNQIINYDFELFAFYGFGWNGIIASGGSQNITVTFQPELYGNSDGLMIDSNSTNSGGNRVSLVGMGLTRVIELSGNLDFGNVIVGQTTTHTLTISNISAYYAYDKSDLTVISITYPNGFSGDWSDGNIGPTSSKTVTVTFSPTIAQSYNGIATVNSDKQDGINTIAISGTGIPATRIISLSGNLAFGNVNVNSTKQLTFTIQNTGNSPLTVSSITYPSGFSGNWNSGTIAAGGSQNVTVTFTPTAAQYYGGNVTVNSDKTSGTNTIAISGTGTPVNTRIINLSSSLAFGNVNINSTKQLTFTIQNTGNSPLNITSISYPPGFSGNWIGTITAGSSQNVTVTFAPTAAQSYGGNVTVNSDKTSGTNTISISGTGIIPRPQITISSPSVDLGNVSPGAVNHILYKLNLAVAYANATLIELTMQTFGTYQLSDILNFKLHYSADPILDAGDAVLSTQMPAASGIKFAFSVFSKLITSGNTGYLFITADIAGYAANYRTVGISAVYADSIAFAESDVVRSVPTPLTAGGVQTILNMPPYITSITSISPDGTYKAGNSINITVNFSEPVILNGMFSVSLNTNATVALTQNTGTSMGGYYLVKSGDSSPKLNATSISLIGTLQDYQGTDASLTLPTDQNLANTKNIVVDGIAPGAPIISGIQKTYNSKPVWIISSGGGGNGIFQCKLYKNSEELESKQKTSPVAFDYQPSSDLTPGEYTLYVQERDESGNWSAESSFLIQVFSPPSQGILLSENYLLITAAGGTAKFTVRLAVKPQSDVRIGIYSENTAICNVSPASVTLTSSNWNTGVEVSVTDISTGSASQYCNVGFSSAESSDSYFKGKKPDALPVNILKTPDLTTMKSKKAIIVASNIDDLWEETRACAEKADAALRFQGYSDSNIMYLSDDDATLANFEYAVKTWGHEPYAGAVIDELLIYMTGHGDIGTFTLNSSGNGILNAGTLKSWLDTLQNNYPGIRVILIYDACYSGSFTDTLRNPAYQRIILTGAGADQIALFGDNGNISFSGPFWDAVMVHGLLNSSFENAEANMIKRGLTQVPRIADMSAPDLKIGLGLRQGSSQIEIRTKFPDMNLICDNSATVWVKDIVPSDNVQNVYVSVRYLNGLRMSDIIAENAYHLLAQYPNEPGKYQARLDCFSQPGTYYVSIYALNMNNKPSEPVGSWVNKSCTSAKVRGDLNNDTRVDLADAIIALRVLAGIRPADLRTDYDSAVDVNGDGRVGMEELIYVLQVVAGLRQQ